MLHAAVKQQHALASALPRVRAVLGPRAPLSVKECSRNSVPCAACWHMSAWLRARPARPPYPAQPYRAWPSMALPCIATHGPAHMCTALQEGWLSASGRLMPAGSDAVEVAFDRFWVDLGSTALRPTLGDPAFSAVRTSPSPVLQPCPLCSTLLPCMHAGAPVGRGRGARGGPYHQLADPPSSCFCTMPWTREAAFGCLVHSEADVCHDYQTSSCTLCNLHELACRRPRRLR